MIKELICFLNMKIFIIKSIVNIFISTVGRNKLSILTYHRVGGCGNAIAMDEYLFEKHLVWVKRYFTPISLSEGLELQAKGDLPRGAIAITVDDGYSDSYNTIFPLLKKHGLTATFFISTIGYEQGHLWDERVAFIVMSTQSVSIIFEGDDYPLSTYEERVNCLIACQNKIKYKTVSERDFLINQLIEQAGKDEAPQQFITHEQTLELAEHGMGVGAHTHSHPILSKENTEIATYEIQHSKKVLESLLGKPIEYFAYPNGKYGLDFDERHVDMVKRAGFLAALSTDKGILKDQKLDGFQIKRFTPWDETELKFVLRLMLNYRL